MNTPFADVFSHLGAGLRAITAHLRVGCPIQRANWREVFSAADAAITFFPITVFGEELPVHGPILGTEANSERKWSNQPCAELSLEQKLMVES